MPEFSHNLPEALDRYALLVQDAVELSHNAICLGLWQLHQPLLAIQVKPKYFLPWAPPGVAFFQFLDGGWIFPTDVP
jgi:hypothetical protein